MASPLPVSAPVTPSELSIHVTGPDGEQAVYSLVAGDALVLGSNPACGVRLSGHGVAGMHCTLSFEDGDLVVDDWDTGGGTYVNGKRVARQLAVSPTAQLQIGSYRIATRPAGNEAEDAPSHNALDEHSAETQEAPLPTAQSLANSPTAIWDSLDDLGPVDEPGSDPASAYSRFDFDDEADELLRIEVEYLRTELAERDARLAELEAAGLELAGSVPEDDLPTRAEVETLVTRLEDLLVELEQSDDRLKTMAELLRASDEANLAAEEERSQMESWIGEVERRVRQWESEWHAERDALNRQLAELTSQRDSAETRGGDAAQAGLIRQLRVDASALQTQINELTIERDALQLRIQTAEVQSIEERVAVAVDEALREERLQVSQLKAEVARERASLAKKQEEMLNQQGLLTAEPDVADIRIRAFREHLRELRESEPERRPQPTMSQRLGKLWRKIEGKPLDTD